MSKLTASQVTEVGRLYRAGETGKQIAKRFSVSAPTIYAALDRQGIERRPSRSQLRNLTPEQIEDAKARYQEGEMLSEIAAEYGVSYYNLNYHLRDVEKYPNGYQLRAFTPEEDEEIGRRYDAGENTYEIADTVECGPMAVKRAILRSGRQMRSMKEAHRIYDIDEAAFAELSPGAAYWIGFIMADGCILDRDGQSWVTGVDLQSKDRAHLEKLVAFLGYTGVIYEGKRGTVALKVSSDEIAQDLMHWGMAERKSLNETPHTALLDSADFWRGEIDGDGTVCLAKGYKPQDRNPVVALVGGETIVKAFAKYVKSFTSTEASPFVNAHGMWRFAVNCGPAVQVIRRLYGECDPRFALDRKLKRAQAIMKQWPNGYAGAAKNRLW